MPFQMPGQSIRQNSELTFKANVSAGRHGWLRLTPAYSVKLVDQILSQTEKHKTVLDPFSGTGTTPLCSAYSGHSAIAFDINDFLVWLGNVKLAAYDEDTINNTLRIGAKIAKSCHHSDSISSCSPPQIHNINRWWSNRDIAQLCAIKYLIDNECSAASQEHDLLLLSFCRILISSSNAAFNHQSMSFKNHSGESSQLSLFSNENSLGGQFLSELQGIALAARNNPKTPAAVRKGDARHLDKFSLEDIGLVITSPPYPNRMSYIRELRPYMYWLSYLTNGRESGELDWKAIGGTWGIATSRLTDWILPSDSYVPQILSSSLDKIQNTQGKNRSLLSKYVSKYFSDIWLHLRSLSKVIIPGALLHYIVGNVCFYGNVVPVENIYADMFIQLGFKDVTIKIIRKRNSNKKLFEFDVISRR